MNFEPGAEMIYEVWKDDLRKLVPENEYNQWKMITLMILGALVSRSDGDENTPISKGLITLAAEAVQACLCNPKLRREALEHREAMFGDTYMIDEDAFTVPADKASSNLM